MGGPFASAWQTRYAKLYPNRLELHHPEGSTGSRPPELIFLDAVQEVARDLTNVKGEQSIVLRVKGDNKIVLTNSVSCSLTFFKYIQFILLIELIF